MNKTILSALIVLLLIGCTPTPPKTITLGFISALSGDAAAYGATERNVVDMAVNEINAAGGIHDQLCMGDQLCAGKGKQLQVVYEDGKCAGKEATLAAQKLINEDHVKIILGGSCSSETLAAAPIAEANKVILFSAFSSNPQITNAGDYIFRNSPSDTEGGKISAEMIVNRGYKKIGVLTENTDYALAVGEVFKTRAQELGAKIVADERFSQDEKDYRAQILKIKAAEPDAIFVNPQTGLTAGLAIKQIRELGLKTPLFSTFALNSPDALNGAGSAAEGVVFSDAPGIDETNLKATQLLKEYTSQYGKPAHDLLMTLRYDSVQILANALKQCDENTDCIKDYLYSIKDYPGASGTYGFDSHGDVDGLHFVVKQVKNGKIETLKEG